MKQKVQFKRRKPERKIYKTGSKINWYKIDKEADNAN